MPEVFLDHNEGDEISLLYLRRYLADSYGLLDGVAWGLGRAVLPRHLMESDGRLKILQPKKVLKIPVYLNFFQQPYYTRLHGEALGAIRAGFKERLR